MQWQQFTPSFIVDISDAYDRRKEAIKAHKSQFFDPNSKEPRTILSQQWFNELIESRARFYGTSIGGRYGEPFYSVEPVGIKDLFDLKLSQG
jgi:LmbE family N-acetylglucosaminyl deacetylase